jgi:hypothetical protein
MSSGDEMTVAPSMEQAAELAELNRIAGEAWAGMPGSEEAEPAGQVDQVAETAAMITVAVQALTPLRPYLPTIYTEAQIGAISGAYVGLAEKYGWATGGGLFERWGPEIAAAAVGIPLLVATSQAERQFRADREKDDSAKVSAHVSEGDHGRQVDQAGPAVVTIGGVPHANQ